MDLLKSKTFWFNAITILIGVVEVISKTYTIPPEILSLIIGIGNVFLRLLTSEQIVSIGGKRIR